MINLRKERLNSSDERGISERHVLGSVMDNVKSNDVIHRNYLGMV